MSKKVTKQVSLPASFTSAAKEDPESAFAYMLMAAQGVQLSAVTATIMSMVDNKDAKIIMMCMAASVQVRGNVTFIGSRTLDIKDKYPLFIIDSGREVDDEYNFKALHVAGHALLSIADSPLSRMFLDKVGNCVRGGSFPANEAGKINSEIFSKWSKDELTAFEAFVKGMDAGASGMVKTVLEGASKKSIDFSKKITEESGKKGVKKG